MTECGRDPFLVTEGAFGRPENTIGSDINGNMLFKDPSLEGTPFEGVGITLEDLRTGGARLIAEMADVNTTNVEVGFFLRYSVDGIWESVELSDTIVVIVTETDWVNISIDGMTYYQTEIEHDLNLSVPVSLGVELWDKNFDKITIHKVNQGNNKTILQSTDKIKMYVVLRKVI